MLTAASAARLTNSDHCSCQNCRQREGSVLSNVGLRLQTLRTGCRSCAQACGRWDRWRSRPARRHEAAPAALVFAFRVAEAAGENPGATAALPHDIGREDLEHGVREQAGNDAVGDGISERHDRNGEERWQASLKLSQSMAPAGPIMKPQR